MGLGQRLGALRRGMSSSKKVAVKELVEGVAVGQSDASTGGEGSWDSMGSLELGGSNFPISITESIDHSACYITVDSTTKGSRVVCHEESRRNQRTVRICLDSEEEMYEVKEITISDGDTMARTMRSRERMAESANCRTSVDCVLDEIVLTMDRDNIYPELSYLTKPMVGRWETGLEMSDPLDPLFKACGINYVKRFVVDKLPLQIGLSYSDDKQFFQLELHIPFGTRLMKWDLHGNSYQDNDPDCGLWDGHVNIDKIDLKTICPKNSKSSQIMQEIVNELGQDADTTIYAPTQIRTHSTIGVVHEARFSVPSEKYGKLLFLKYTLYPKNGGKQIVVMRCLKPIEQTEQ